MDISNLSAAELAELTANAEGWTPEEGDEVQGIVLGVKMGHSKHKEKAGRDPRYPILIVLKNGTNEAVAVHCFQTILETEIRNLKPTKGEEVYIKHLGEGKAKDGNNAPIRYAVSVVGRENEPDPWSSM